MRKNEIADLREIKYLQKCSELTNLWISENPCEQHKDYRAFIIKHLPNLTKLDNQEITN